MKYQFLEGILPPGQGPAYTVKAVLCSRSSLILLTVSKKIFSAFSMSLAVVSLGVSCPGIFSRFALISACLAATFRALALFSRILSLLNWKAWEQAQTVSTISYLDSLSSMSRAVTLSALEPVTSSGSRLRTEVLPSPAPTPTSRPDS